MKTHISSSLKRLIAGVFGGIFLISAVPGQTYSGTGGSLSPNSTTCFQVTVAHNNDPMNASFGLQQACFNISVGDVGDVDVWLISPNGSQVLLTCCNNGVGGSGTYCFNQTASGLLTGAVSPGSFNPLFELGNMNDGQTSTGVWELCVINNGPPATLNSWNLTLGNTPAPPVAYIGNNSCMVETCGPMKFYDSGGPLFDYTNSEDLVKTFCPPSDGQCIRLTLNSWDIETSFDALDVYNGEDLNAPYIGFLDGTGTGPLTVTSTNGCLTFNFQSDFIVAQGGWDANISCVPCAATVASSRPVNDDCASAIPLAGSGSNASATGCDIDSPDPWGAPCGWLSTENSMFYSFNVNSGTTQPVQITLNSVSCTGGANQLQMAIFNANCDSVGLFGSNFHGCTAGVGTVTLTANPNPLPNGNYILVVDGNAGADCSWNVSSPVLSVDDILFRGEFDQEQGIVRLEWEESEAIRVDGYTIERSNDRQEWDAIGYVEDEVGKQAGNFADYKLRNREVYYYRLKFQDGNGATHYSHTVEIRLLAPVADEIFRTYPNPVVQELNIDLATCQDGDISLEVFNLRGERVHNQSWSGQRAGYHHLEIESAEFENGVYLYKLRYGNAVESGKFLVAH